MWLHQGSYKGAICLYHRLYLTCHCTNSLSEMARHFVSDWLIEMSKSVTQVSRARRVDYSAEDSASRAVPILALGFAFWQGPTHWVTDTNLSAESDIFYSI